MFCLVIKISQNTVINCLCLRPWHFIKNLLPWFWFSEEDVEKTIRIIKKPKNRGVIFKRYKCFFVLIDNSMNKKWYTQKISIHIVKKS